MLLNPDDQKRVDALTFASNHRDHEWGTYFRRSDVVKAAERSADTLPAAGRSDERELAVIWRFASQVFKHLGLEVRIA